MKMWLKSLNNVDGTEFEFSVSRRFCRRIMGENLVASKGHTPKKSADILRFCVLFRNIIDWNESKTLPPIPQEMFI